MESTHSPAFLTRVTSPTSARLSIRAEDTALIAVILLTSVLEPVHVLLPIVGDSGSSAGGILSLVAVIGAIAAMATRVPNPIPHDVKPLPAERMWLTAPFIGAVGFIGTDSLARLGLRGGDAFVLLAFAVFLLSTLFADRLPVVRRGVRRIMVAPFVLLSGALFQRLVHDAVEALGGSSGPIAGLAQTVGSWFFLNILAIIGFVAAAFYMMLILAPRELADPGGTRLSWAVRFCLFYGSLLAAILVEGELPILFT